MANYVHNKIICTKEVLNKYFIDYYPFNDEDKLNKPYITFNNIFNVKSINEYSPNIYYGYGFTYDKIEDDKYEIKFFTRWLYPIEAILKVISLCKNDITWYACEGNMNIVSKFYYKNKKVYEDVLDLSNTDFEDWYKNNIESGKALPSMSAFFFICDYLNITPKDFFDTESIDSNQISLVNSLKKLSPEEINHVSLIVNDIIKK